MRRVEYLAHGLDAHVAVLHLPFVIGFKQDSADEVNDRGFGRKDERRIAPSPGR